MIKESTLEHYKGFCLVGGCHGSQNYFKVVRKDNFGRDIVLAIKITVRDDFKDTGPFYVFSTTDSREIRPKIIYKDKKGAYIKKKTTHRRIEHVNKCYLSPHLQDKAQQFLEAYYKGLKEWAILAKCEG